MTLLSPVRTLLGCWLWLRAFVTGPPAVPKVCPYCDGLGRHDGCPSCQKLSADWADDFSDAVKAADATRRVVDEAERRRRARPFDAVCARLEMARQDERVRRALADAIERARLAMARENERIRRALADAIDQAHVDAAKRWLPRNGGPPPWMTLTGIGWEGGHGHVTPRRDGLIAGCGGPAACRQCAVEQADRDRARLIEPRPAKDVRGA